MHGKFYSNIVSENNAFALLVCDHGDLRVREDRKHFDNACETRWVRQTHREVYSAGPLM